MDQESQPQDQTIAVGTASEANTRPQRTWRGNHADGGVADYEYPSDDSDPLD